ncbi:MULTISPECIES: phosphotransferase family protein [Pseudofrankia]|uniref:phosphotransferase family protein n=1 Tax=Pseudofrankia TaxID=2994363 RepID=UPI000234B3BA|nr:MULTISPECIES: aminoglycoside phosphotransferase family protein [Pseudofrankia]OHV29862.1 hypothetical protein BCD49_35485 [Pseudofrankia sp. EUN1h]
MGVAARLDTETGPVFVKASPLGAPAIGHYRREADANAALPPGTPVPRMLWSAEIEGWLLLLFEYLDGRDSDLAPGSLDLAAVGRVIETLAGRLTPSPWERAPSVVVKIKALYEKAGELLGRCPEEFSGLAAATQFDLGAVEGASLLHADPHPGNYVVTADGVRVIDWSHACRGAAWVDAALLAPRLVVAGHSPAEAEALMDQLSVWGDAPARAVTGLGAVTALFWAHQARFGPPRMRARRAVAAAAGLAWATHRITRGH